MAATLPFTSEFSPATVELTDVLEAAAAHAGDLAALEARFKAKYFDRTATSERNKAIRAYNVRLGMQKYILLDGDGHLTDTGQRLLALRGDARNLHEEFARHILLRLHGATLVQCLIDMHDAGEAVSLQRLRQWMGERGVSFPPAGTHASKMRLWLEKAGIVVGWRVDRAKFQELLGVSTGELDVLAGLTPEQRAYLRALANIGTGEAQRSNDVQKLATAAYGAAFNEKNLPQQVLYPLRDAGYIVLERGTKESGRGAKPFRVTATAKLQTEIIEPLLAQIDAQTNANLRPLLRRSIADIRAALSSSDRNVKGMALEALAFKLMRLLGLDFVDYRKRGPETGGAEVDLIFESTGAAYMLWQVQCKNTGMVSLEDVAKEVGLKGQLRSNVIVIISTGTISAEARRFATQEMGTSNASVFLIDGADLDTVEANATDIVRVFAREARHARAVKRSAR